MCSTVTSGNSAGMMRFTVTRHSREVSSTLALSTEVSFLRRPRAKACGEPHDAFNLGKRIAAHIDRFGGRAGFLTEINAAREFAHHHDVHAAQQCRL